MRNGNEQPLFVVLFALLRSYPTYEEWKPFLIMVCGMVYHGVLILPMRNGNKYSYKKMGQLPLVLILPMRNGNKYTKADFSSVFACSYPTYEEWKRIEFIIIHSTCEVLILPMRNGNLLLCAFQLLLELVSFLSYL